MWIFHLINNEIAKLFEQHGLIRRKHIDNLIEARDFKTMSFNYGKKYC